MYVCFVSFFQFSFDETIDLCHFLSHEIIAPKHSTQNIHTIAYKTYKITYISYILKNI